MAAPGAAVFARRDLSGDLSWLSAVIEGAVQASTILVPIIDQPYETARASTGFICTCVYRRIR